MTLQLKAHFDGKVIVPDDPVDAPINQPLTVQASVDSVAENESEAQWGLGIAREWAAELSDPREDIYTVDDGKRTGPPLFSVLPQAHTNTSDAVRRGTE
jgi:hypothetical protein